MRRTWRALGSMVMAACVAACGSSSGGDGSGGGGSPGTYEGPATFQCGDETCKAGQVCSSTTLAISPPQTGGGCVTLSAECAATPTCDCLQQYCNGIIENPGFDKCGCDATGCFVDCVEP